MNLIFCTMGLKLPIGRAVQDGLDENHNRRLAFLLSIFKLQHFPFKRSEKVLHIFGLVVVVFA